MRVIGLDIGGTKIAGGIVSLADGGLLLRRVIPTNAHRAGEEILDEVVSLARALRDEAASRGMDIRGIGAGVAELVDEAGNVTSGHTIRWRGLPVRERLREVAPAVVESDVRAAALAEARLGAGRPFRIFVYVTVGSGISSCLVQDGKPYAGARGGALVVASAPVTVVCSECGAELHPVLEEIASGPALLRRYRERGGEAVSTQQVLAAAAAGDRAAFEVVARGAEALGAGAGWLVNTLDPEAVIVGGGLGLAGGLFWEKFEESTRRHIWADGARDLPVRTGALGVDAGLIGAACAWETRGRSMNA
ncbi:MAG: ROK family protein [Bryobacteraceae bacterium]|nr:ROK family protein [Bryobacteraceae bacterium]